MKNLNGKGSKCHSDKFTENFTAKAPGNGACTIEVNVRTTGKGLKHIELSQVSWFSVHISDGVLFLRFPAAAWKTYDISL